MRFLYIEYFDNSNNDNNINNMACELQIQKARYFSCYCAKNYSLVFDCVFKTYMELKKGPSRIKIK